jgi:hypothetical protein
MKSSFMALALFKIAQRLVCAIGKSVDARLVAYPCPAKNKPCCSTFTGPRWWPTPHR